MDRRSRHFDIESGPQRRSAAVASVPVAHHDTVDIPEPAPGELDDTFGPQLVFAKAPQPGEVNLPPSAGLQFFGQVDIDAAEVMTVTLKDLTGAALFSQVLEPAS